MSRLTSQLLLWCSAVAVSGALLLVSTSAHSRTPGPFGARGQGAAAPAAPAAAPSPRGPAPGVRGAAPGHNAGQAAHPQRAYPHTHHNHYHNHHRGSRVGVFVGAPIVAAPWWHYPDPYYAYGPAYYPPAAPVYRYEEPAVYVEQPAPPPQSAPAPAPAYWYYCEDSKTYFPYVQTCTTPWLRVMPHAPQP